MHSADRCPDAKGRGIGAHQPQRRLANRDGIRDCDDNAAGYVTFTTNLEPSLARDAFSADPACARDDEDTTTFGVSCTSPTGSLYVSFDVEDGTTVGVVDF